MLSMRRIAAAAAIGGLMMVALTAGEVPPSPVFEFIDIRAMCEAQPAADRYLYTYTLSTGRANTVEVWSLNLSLGESMGQVQELSEPQGWTDIVHEAQGSDPRRRFPPAPFLSWVIMEARSGPFFGGTFGPFRFSVAVPPSLQEATVNPWLDPYFDAHLEATGESEILLEESAPLEEMYTRKIPTLAPLGVPPGSFAHWDVFLSDVAKAGELGWISDGGLLGGIRENLSAARSAALQGNLSEVNGKLDLVIAAAEGAGEAQMRREAKDLIVLNARYLKANLPWPCEPKLTLEPERAVHPLGETAVVTARLLNTATGLPIANNGLTVEVTEGPHVGTKREGTTDGNNGASSRLSLVVGEMPENRPPDCRRASAAPSRLWPPDHKPAPIAIAGVTDPDGDPVTLTVTAITQDEPTNGLGDGDTSPDGFGVGTASPQVRAERSGTGNGRVYKIAFTASDGKGGSCEGAVTVGVPHDPKDTPIDDGQAYDSTK